MVVMPASVSPTIDSTRDSPYLADVELDGLFLDTLEDLRRRTDLRASEYDAVQAAGLVRRLLLDKTPLYAEANRDRRAKIEFRWSQTFVALGTQSAGAWIPYLWLDPELASLKDMPPELLPAFAGAQRAGSLHKFLAFEVVQVQWLRPTPDAPSQLTHVRVKEVIQHYAHREGGVHFDASPADNAALEVIRQASELALRMTLIAISRIAYRALEPLAARIVLEERPHPLGLGGPPLTYRPS